MSQNPLLPLLLGKQRLLASEWGMQEQLLAVEPDLQGIKSGHWRRTGLQLQKAPLILE
jgi:hypothetical protein